MNDEHIECIVNSIIQNPNTKIEFDTNNNDIVYVIDVYRRKKDFDVRAFSTEQLYRHIEKSIKQ